MLKNNYIFPFFDIYHWSILINIGTFAEKIKLYETITY
jgi:hypothetical protein